MFGGQWKESSENIVTLEIPDPNIDKEGHYNVGEINPCMYVCAVPLVLSDIHCPTCYCSTGSCVWFHVPR